jgi:hypothetical protein
MDLDLHINGTRFRLRESRDVSRLRSAAFRAHSLWDQLTGGRLGPRKRYRAANCTVACFGGAFDLYPRLESYLSHDRRWQTAAGLIYLRDRLVEVRFEVIDGRYAAPTFWERFHEAATRPYGEPHSTADDVYFWNGAAMRLEATLSKDRINCLFRWFVSARKR